MSSLNRKSSATGFAIPLLLATLAGCTAPNSAPAEQCGTPALARPLLVLESNETTASALGSVGANGCFRELAEQKLGRDPALSDAHGRPFVCDDDQGICYEVDKNTLQIPAFGLVTYQDEANTTSNPHDLDVDASGQYWIARYDLPSVAVLGADGSFAGAVDLSSLADADGIPEMDAVTVVGDRAYVTLQRLDRKNLYAETGPGKIAVIDVNTRAVVSSFALVGENPFGPMNPVLSDPSGATVAIAMPGSFLDASCTGCGVEEVDLVKGTSTQVLVETDVGGSVSQAVIASADEGYAILATPDSDNATWVVAFNPTTRAITRTLADTRPLPVGQRGYYYWSLAIDGDLVIVGDRTPGSPGLHFYRRADGKEVTAEIPVQIFPPASLLAL